MSSSYRGGALTGEFPAWTGVSCDPRVRSAGARWSGGARAVQRLLPA